MNYLLVANLFLLLFLGVADNQMIAALLPVFVRSLDVSVSVAGLLVVVYSVAAAVAAFGSGALSDHYGRRGFLLVGVAFFALASWSASRTHTFGGLMAARALTGLAAGTISTCSIAYAGDSFAYGVRGKAIGLISSAYFAAPIIGVPLAGQIADRFGWRGVFVSFAVLAAVVTLITLALPKDSIAQGSPSDLRAPLRVFRGFLRQRDLVAALSIAFLVSGGLVGFITYIGQWLNDHFHVPTGSITMVFMVGGLASLLGAPLGGILADRWGKRNVSIASNVLLALAVAMIPFQHWGLWLMVVFGVTGLGAAFRHGPLTALMTELVPRHQRGSFIAVRNISSQFGIGAVAFVGGLLYQRSGYLAVTTLCAAMTALVAILLTTHIVEPQPLDIEATGVQPLREKV
jgi:MFS transporter, DHA1 family, inner membrane transport protein